VPPGLTLFLPSNDALAATTRGTTDAAQLSEEARAKETAAALYAVGSPATGALPPEALQSAGQVATALPGAAPLTVFFDNGWFSDALSLTDATGAVASVVATVQACGSVLHVVDQVRGGVRG
jgi:hypothetical protein